MDATLLRRPSVRQWAGRGTATVALLAIMAVILVPLAVVAVGSFWSARFIRLAGQLTFDNFTEIFTSASAGRIFLTTLELTLGASALALVLGGVQAWIVARTDLPGKAVLRWLPVTPLLLSALVANFGWTALYSRDAGIINNFLQQRLGLNEPIFNIYSMPGLIVALGTHLAPIPYLIMLSPLSSMGASLDEASRASGAGRLRTLWSVSLPLLRPALLSSFTLAAIVAAHAFETPVILGGPAEIHTYVSEIYRAIAVSVNYSAASALAMVYLALIGLMLWWNRRMTRNEAKYALIAGRGYVAVPASSRTVRIVGAAIVVFIFLFSVVQLLAANLFVSLLPYYTATAELPPFTLENYRDAFTTPRSLEAIRNSLVMAATVAALAVVVSTFLAIVAYKTKIRGRRLAEEVGTLPVSFPPIVFSMAILLTFLSIPGFSNMYNTIYLPILVLTVVFLPFALRVVGSGMMGIDNSLLEASASSGARLWTTIRTVVLPLLGVALTGAFALVLVFSFRELGGIALISPPNVALLPTHVYGLWQTSHLPDLYALNMISFAVTVGALVVLGICLYAIARRVRRRATAELEVGLIEKPSVEKAV
jgi:iron(III) transport system permease protein